jgi:hypothetical protein
MNKTTNALPYFQTQNHTWSAVVRDHSADGLLELVETVELGVR